MKGKDIATGRARAEALDPLHAARTTRSLPPYYMSSPTHAKYVHSLSRASGSVRRITERYNISSRFQR